MATGSPGSEVLSVTRGAEVLSGAVDVGIGSRVAGASGLTEEKVGGVKKMEPGVIGATGG